MINMTIEERVFFHLRHLHAFSKIVTCVLFFRKSSHDADISKEIFVSLKITTAAFVYTS